MGITVRSVPRHRAPVVVLLLAMVAGCGSDALDVSSLEDLEESLAVLREPMTVDELNRFDEALGYLVGDVELTVVGLDSKHAEWVLNRYRPLAGRTAEGLVAEARFRRIREVRSAVIWLETWRDESEAARRELALFRFTAARVYKRHRDFLEWPVIEIKVENGTDHTVSLAHFRAALLADDDGSPWLFEEFDHVALWGLAPGERDVWRIEPAQQEWIRLIDPHPNLQFSLEVMRLEALGGRVLAATDWGGVEEHWLTLHRETLRRIRESGRLALDSPPRATMPLPARRAVPADEAKPSTDGAESARVRPHVGQRRVEPAAQRVVWHSVAAGGLSALPWRGPLRSDSSRRMP
jgi:hypothetical protein